MFSDILVGAIIIVLAGVIGLVVVGIAWHNWKVHRVRKAYQAIPDDVKARVLQYIEEAVKRRKSVTLYRMAADSPHDKRDDLLRSRIGGVPYAEAGDSWPADRPGEFLLQIVLDEPRLGNVWQGRLLTLYLMQEYDQIVRSYENPSLSAYAPLTGMSLPPRPSIPLKTLRVPIGGEEPQAPAYPEQLLEMEPRIADELQPYGRDYVGLLAQILHPNVYAYNLDTPDLAYAGGEPSLIQGPHDPLCQTCNNPMRFLLQVGDFVPGVQMADAGVYYVYGCDDHPQHCIGIVDSH